MCVSCFRTKRQESSSLPLSFPLWVQAYQLQSCKQGCCYLVCRFPLQWSSAETCFNARLCVSCWGHRNGWGPALDLEALASSWMILWLKLSLCQVTSTSFRCMHLSQGFSILFSCVPISLERRLCSLALSRENCLVSTPSSSAGFLRCSHSHSVLSHFAGIPCQWQTSFSPEVHMLQGSLLVSTLSLLQAPNSPVFQGLVAAAHVALSVWERTSATFTVPHQSSATVDRRLTQLWASLRDV